MATYKVIQDIEADDKLLGPLSLKQFIYFAIAAVCLYLTFFAATKGAAFLAIIFIPPALFFGVLGFPWSNAQPTEVWLLAKVRFFFKPRKRVWDQAGIKELVTITVPKKIERQLTDGLNEAQVKGRLSALAQTIDSRGWAVKQLQSTPFGGVSIPDSDRLTAGTTTQQSRVTTDVGLEEDVLDERNNPTAQKIDQMINQSSEAHKAQVRSQMQQAHTQQDAPQTTPSTDFWFMNQPDPTKVPPGMTTGQGGVVTPYSDSRTPINEQPQTSNSNTPAISKETEDALLKKLHSKKTIKTARSTHEKTILPLSEQAKAPSTTPAALQTTPEKPKVSEKSPERASASTPDPAILELANNDDLNVETIARQANKRKDEPTDEVVISLH